MTKLRSPISLLLGIALGVGGCALAVWNPFGWAQIDHLLGRSHELHQLTDSSGSTLYTCGMHPHVIQDEPGTCPICGMNLVPVGGTTPEPSSDERQVLYWRAPMDPSYTSDEPGKSPMGMDLVPVYEDETSTDGGVRVSPSFLQNFAVRTTEVLSGSLPIEIRTVGILAHNEERVVSVNTKFEGWIEEARVNNVGEHVAKGDVLFGIYSPELVTTQREYLAAMDYVERLKSNEAYVCQYLDHKIAVHPIAGKTILSRSNLHPKNPFSASFCLQGAKSASTDGYQFFGTTSKLTGEPAALGFQSLEDRVKQYEFAYAALQSRKIELQPCQSGVTVFGLC